jgi:hypothetical protein
VYGGYSRGAENQQLLEEDGDDAMPHSIQGQGLCLGTQADQGKHLYIE